jgi:hypothetical protein
MGTNPTVPTEWTCKAAVAVLSTIMSFCPPAQRRNQPSARRQLVEQRFGESFGCTSQDDVVKGRLFCQSLLPVPLPNGDIAIAQSG